MLGETTLGRLRMKRERMVERARVTDLGNKRRSNRLELDQHYQAGQIQAEISGRGTAGIHRCACVCV